MQDIFVNYAWNGLGTCCSVVYAGHRRVQFCLLDVLRVTAPPLPLNRSLALRYRNIVLVTFGCLYLRFDAYCNRHVTPQRWARLRCCCALPAVCCCSLPGEFAVHVLPRSAQMLP
jgi:hypothetical protein